MKKKENTTTPENLLLIYLRAYHSTIFRFCLSWKELFYIPGIVINT